MDDLVDAVGQRPGLPPEAEAVLGDVPAHGHDPFAVWMLGPEQAAQGAPQPAGGHALVACTHERVHRAIAVFEVPSQELHAEKSGGAGEQYPVLAGPVLLLLVEAHSAKGPIVGRSLAITRAVIRSTTRGPTYVSDTRAGRPRGVRFP